MLRRATLVRAAGAAGAAGAASVAAALSAAGAAGCQAASPSERAAIVAELQGAIAKLHARLGDESEIGVGFADAEVREPLKKATRADLAAVGVSRLPGGEEALQLFNGSSLDGWRAPHKGRWFRADGGTIVSRSDPFDSPRVSA